MHGCEKSYITYQTEVGKRQWKRTDKRRTPSWLRNSQKTGWEDVKTVSGCGKALLNTLFCMWAWQLNLLLALPAKQACLANSWKILVAEGLQRARRLGLKSLISALNSSRALAALAPKFSTNSPIEPVSNLLWWCLWFLCGLAHHGYVHTIMPDSSCDLRRYKSLMK